MLAGKRFKENATKMEAFPPESVTSGARVFYIFYCPIQITRVVNEFSRNTMFGEGCYLQLRASHFRVSLYGRLFSGPSGSLPAFTEYCENFVKFYLQLYKLPGICRRVFDLCDKDSNGTLSFRVTSTCYVNYAISSQPHCLQLTLCWSRRRGKGANSSKIASESRR